MELLKAEGADGQIEVHNDRIVINRKGIFCMILSGFAPPKEIPIKSIGSVDFKEAGLLTQGILVVNPIGETPQQIKFAKKVSDDFKAVKDIIFDLING
jgi:hypothetical protein